MSLRIRRGTNAQRTGGILDQGELGYTTDTKKLYIGDGVTYGGTNVVAGCAGTGLTWNETTQTLNTTGGGGGGVSLPANSAGVLKNNGSGVLTWNPVFPPSANGILTNNGSGALAWTSLTNLIQISNDDAPTLAGDLDISGYNLYNGNDITLAGALTNSEITITGGDFKSTASFYFTNISPKKIEFNGLSNGSSFITSPFAIFSSSNGTIDIPTNSSPSDCLGSIFFRGVCHETTGWVNAGGLSVALSSTADITSTYAESVVSILTGSNSNTLNTFTFDYNGVFTAPILKATSYATTSLPPNPESGWIVYDSTENNFKGYVGAPINAWVVLG